ncbi:MAG: hypothetical protein RBR53_01105 [Desulforegulaceae bacterium]|nr:hypothetical protein [Desulforegulaceae bacterium]
MTKFSYIATIMVSIIILTAGQAIALSPVSPEKMKTLTGQSGIRISSDNILGIDWTAENLIFRDDDGTDGNPASLLIKGIVYSGKTFLDNPVSINQTTSIDPYTGRLTSGINVELDKSLVQIDRYHIGSITIQGEDGVKFMNDGKSFGSITVEGFKAEISGNIRISSFND